MQQYKLQWLQCLYAEDLTLYLQENLLTFSISFLTLSDLLHKLNQIGWHEIWNTPKHNICHRLVISQCLKWIWPISKRIYVLLLFIASLVGRIVNFEFFQLFICHAIADKHQSLSSVDDNFFKNRQIAVNNIAMFTWTVHSEKLSLRLCSPAVAFPSTQTTTYVELLWNGK